MGITPELLALSDYLARNEVQRDDHGRFASGAGGGGGGDASHQTYASIYKGFFSKGALGKAAAVAKSLGHTEHVVAGGAKAQWERDVAALTPKAQVVARGIQSLVGFGVKALFAPWTAGSALAERTAIKRGASPEDAAKFRAVLNTVDMAAFTTLKVASLAGVHAAHLPFAVASIVPVASVSHMVAMAAKDRSIMPHLRAAKELATEQLTKLSGAAQTRMASLRARFSSAPAAAPPPRSFKPRLEALGVHADAGPPDTTDYAAVALAIQDAFEKHKYDDWYTSLFCAALDVTGDVATAIVAADEAYRAAPQVPDVQPQPDDEDVVLGGAYEAITGAKLAVS